MVKSKSEQMLLELVKEFEEKSKEINKISEKIKAKEKQIESLTMDIAEMNTKSLSLGDDLIGIMKKRQRLSKKLFGVNGDA